MSSRTHSVPLRFQTEETPSRHGEPVSVALPWPKGAVHDVGQFRLIDPMGNVQPLQARMLDEWNDESIQWCLFELQVNLPADEPGYRIEVDEEIEGMDPPLANFGSARRLGAKWTAQLQSSEADTISTYDPIFVFGEDIYDIRDTYFDRQSQDATYQGLTMWGLRQVFNAPQFQRASLQISNPKPSSHPNGNWDLGNDGSVIIRQLHIRIPFPDKMNNPQIHVSAERNQPFKIVSTPFAITQHSSGGENSHSTNHIDRERKISVEKIGYDTNQGVDGLRATPIVTVNDENHFLGVTMPDFWENFPKQIRVEHNAIYLDLFMDETELQGGEQKTHTFYISHGRDNVTDEPMVWCRSPALCHAEPQWYAASGAIPYLTPKATDPNRTYLNLVDQAIEGDDTFVHKREIIDEYGWRHFGDIYGDHEATRHQGPTPLISHYNNQYDCVLGFAIQFLRSGDKRWWDQMIACANHTCDIDVYHTTHDKAAYNGGLFWHTYHYADADTGTHRSYPKSLTKAKQDSLQEKMEELGETAKSLQRAYAVGGGPSASHNYNAGLLLAYQLTGNALYAATAQGLADFVISMEEPSTTPFRFLSREYTGLATESGGGGYHGPGRASANSVNALLVGYRLTSQQHYLDKAEPLIRRVSHPKQNLDALDLLNAELRWFYTMFLQALGNYLDLKIELNQLDDNYTYGQLTLLHYTRWMAKHEHPILDTPEKLQYPNETWAAQDMRKVEVFQYAAKHAHGDEKALFLEKAEWFFRYVEDTLDRFETKSLCRPVVLMMNFGWSHTWWQTHPDVQAPSPDKTITVNDFGEWKMFVPQKQIAIKRAKMIIVAVGLLGLAFVAMIGAYLLS